MSEKQVIKFNVGGEDFITTKTTLDRFGENMLTKITSTSVPAVEIDGAYFIDRDGELFGHVLNVLRGSFDYKSNQEILEQVQSELDYYTIQTNITDVFEQIQVAKVQKSVQNANVVLENLGGRWSMAPDISAHGRKVFAIETGQEIHFLFRVTDQLFFPDGFEFEKAFHARETFLEFVAFCAKYTPRKIAWETVGPVRLFYISY